MTLEDTLAKYTAAMPVIEQAMRLARETVEIGVLADVLKGLREGSVVEVACRINLSANRPDARVEIQFATPEQAEQFNEAVKRLLAARIQGQ